MTDKKIYTSKISESYRIIGPYLGLGTQLAATMVVMFFLGKCLDDTLNTTPILIIIFSFLGGFVAMFNFIKTVLHLNKKNKIDKSS